MSESPSLLLPAAVLRLWEERGRNEGNELLRISTKDLPGVYWPRPDLCAISPIAADPAVFDLGVLLAADLLARCAGAGVGPRILLLPGQVRHHSDGTELIADPLLDDLDAAPPSLTPGKIYLSTYAAARLERRHQLRSAGFYSSPRGLRIPLVQSLGEDVGSPPYRNLEILRRRPAYVPRPRTDPALAAPTRWLLVSGALGTGKSRSVFEALSTTAQPVVWVQAPTPRQSAVSLAERTRDRLRSVASALGLKTPGLFSDPETLGSADPGALALQLPKLLAELGVAAGASPVLVVDDLEAASGETLWQLEPLLEAAREGKSFRLITIGRPGSPWPRGWPLPPTVEVEPMATAALEKSLAPLASGLSLPERMQKRLLAFAAGHPFALEEGLAALVHQQLIRQVYGSFFWSGGTTEEFRPSDRWIQHAEAEALRLGQPLTSRFLAVSETALPMAVLAAAAAELGEVPTANWPLSKAVSGWVRHEPSSWGPGITLACPAVAAALAATLDEPAVLAMRQALGRALPGAEERTAWQRYRLLATAPEALPLLIEAVEKHQAPPQEALAALSTELEALRRNRPNEHLELLTLWHLLPLARRLGKLRAYLPDLGRARELARNEPKKAMALAGLAAEIAESEGRFTEAEGLIRESLAGTSGQDEQTGALLVLRLGRLLIRQERFQEARELLERVLPLFVSAGARSLEAGCRFYLGNVAIHQHRLADALELHERSLALRRQGEKSKALGSSISAIGRIALLEGQYPKALARYREAEALFVKSGEKTELAFALLGVGKALSRLGDYAGASTPLRQALALREEAEEQVGEALARLAVAENYFHLQRLDEALREARRALFDLRLQTSLSSAIGDAERLMGRILLGKRQLSEAKRSFAQACEAHRKANDSQALVLDQAHWMEAAILSQEVDRVEHLVVELDAVLEGEIEREWLELVEFRQFQGLSWLAERQSRPRGALEHLRRAYSSLLAKADQLSPLQRHSFLFQVREHAEIVAAATAEGLAWQSQAEVQPPDRGTVPLEPLL